MDSAALKQLQQRVTGGGLQLQAGASADVRIGRYLDQQDRERRDRWQSIHSVPIKASGLTGLAAANGVLDFPTMAGPEEGWWWDVRRISCWGFSAGTVSVYLNDATGAGELAGVFPSAGALVYGGNLFLGPRDRMVFVAAGVTGSVFVGGNAIEVAARWWPEYLL